MAVELAARRAGKHLVFSGSLCVHPAVQIAQVLPDAISLDLLALGDKLADFAKVKLEEEVELVADGAAEVVFGCRLLVVEVARGDLEELLGAEASLFGLLVASLGVQAEIGHLDVLRDLAVALQHLSAEHRGTSQARNPEILLEEFVSLRCLAELYFHLLHESLQRQVDLELHEVPGAFLLRLRFEVSIEELLESLLLLRWIWMMKALLPFGETSSVLSAAGCTSFIQRKLRMNRCLLSSVECIVLGQGKDVLVRLDLDVLPINRAAASCLCLPVLCFGTFSSVRDIFASKSKTDFLMEDTLVPLHALPVNVLCLHFCAMIPEQTVHRVLVSAQPRELRRAKQCSLRVLDLIDLLI